MGSGIRGEEFGYVGRLCCEWEVAGRGRTVTRYSVHSLVVDIERAVREIRSKVPTAFPVRSGPDRGEILYHEVEISNRVQTGMLLDGLPRHAVIWPKDTDAFRTRGHWEAFKARADGVWDETNGEGVAGGRGYRQHDLFMRALLSGPGQVFKVPETRLLLEAPASGKHSAYFRRQDLESLLHEIMASQVMET